MFRLWPRVFIGIKSIKYASMVAFSLVLMTGLITIFSACDGQTAEQTPLPKPIPAPQPILAQEERIGLELSLVGRYPYGVTAGEAVTSFLEIKNTGTKAFTNIRLSSIQPEGWTIDFKPSTIDSLSPGYFQTVELNIKPEEKTAEGGYTVTLIADASEARKVLDIWLTVEAPKGYWLWIGGAILLLVVAGFIIVYLRLGRK